MTQKFRTHRLFMLLSWIDALSRGYGAPQQRRPADAPLRGELHRVPTVSNLAYYLLTDADYQKDALTDRFSRWAVKNTPSDDVFMYVKRDLTRHLSQYPGGLFSTVPIRKTPENHASFNNGLESRSVEAKAYYLTERGKQRLAELDEVMEFKRELVTHKKTVTGQNKRMTHIKKETVLTGDAIDQVVGDVDIDSISFDSIIVPNAKRWKWKTVTYTLPHVAVVDASRDRAPMIHRD